MKIHGPAISQLTKSFQPQSYYRLIPLRHRTTPLGTSSSNSRFSSTSGNFHTLYAAKNLATALAETVIRDRFEGADRRWLHVDEVRDLCTARVSGRMPLQLLDIRKSGCLLLGVSTDINGAKGWEEAREFVQCIHDGTKLDGILYSSRLTAENCIAVFDRAIPAALISDRVSEVDRLRNLKAALVSLKIELAF
jgi:hypothetical protein